MVYNTKRQADLVTRLTFGHNSPLYRAHKVVKATVNGKPAGWTVVLRG